LALGEKTCAPEFNNGRERPHELFWAAESRKSGVAPAQFGDFFCVTFLFLVSVISPFSRDLRGSQGEEDGEDEAEVRNSYPLLLLRPNSQRAHRRNFCWAGATHESLWPRNRVRKWGRSSPTQGFPRVQIDRRALQKLLFLGHLLDRQGDRESDAYGD